jgi:sporulation integral membrane protein YlbJ
MPGRIKKNRSRLFAGLLLCFFAILLIKPENVMKSGQKALELCFNIIIPSLFPFFVVSRLISNTGVIHTVSRIFRPIMKPLFNLPGSAAFPLIAGWFSGYPAGAKYTVDLYEKKILTQKESERLLAFCNNSGPLFIVGAVGTGYFQSPRLGLVLLVSHLSASITIGIGAGIISRKKELPYNEILVEPEGKHTEINGHILTDAVMNSIMALLQICGTIFFFAVVVQALEAGGVFTLISNFLSLITGTESKSFEMVKIFLAGSLEITYGLFLLSNAANVPVTLKVLLAAMFCGFGGFSVHTQVTGLCPFDFKLKSYYFGKIMHGVLAAAFTGLILINQSIPVMKSGLSLYSINYSGALLIVYALLLILIISYIISTRLG